MNKLMGFYELQQLNLPSVPWKEYREGTILDPNVLWTIRSAVWKGDDLNLPRLVGVESNEAVNFANKLRGTLGENGLIIYYPYFIAEKSGTLDVNNSRIVIEAVESDLWNMVTYNDKDVSIIINDEGTIYIGNEYFLNKAEKEELLSVVPNIKKRYRDYLYEGKSVLLEWSFAYKSGVNKVSIGEKYLVFYEIRTI